MKFIILFLFVLLGCTIAVSEKSKPWIIKSVELTSDGKYRYVINGTHIGDFIYFSDSLYQVGDSLTMIKIQK